MNATRSSGARLLAATVASVLLVASAVAVDRSRADEASGDAAAEAVPWPTPAPTAPPSPAPPRTEAPSPTPDPAAASVELLSSVAAASAASGEELLAAGLAVAQGPWRSLTDPAWPVREEQPVYVAEVTVAEDAARIEATVVVAWRQEEGVDELVLRSLPTSADLRRAGAALEIEVILDGQPVEFEEDAGGARIVVPVSLAAGTAHHLRVAHRYDLVDSADLAGDGGPASFGLLARTSAADGAAVTANLGHWLPLLTFDPAPMVDWGDVGAFPVAIWSVVIDHPGWLVTGGDDGPCPDDPATGTGPSQPPGCTWARGVSLRDVSGVWFADAPRVAGERVRQLDVRTIAPSRTASEQTNQRALSETVASAEIFTAALGPLAWREFDVVAAPLLSGAAGMEFPGLVIIDSDIYGDLGGAIGTYVITHEVAHQWFHALVGNSSLNSPVVDEAIAQYLSYLYWVETYGEEAAAAFAEATLRERYRAAQGRGVEDEPPAQPLEGFSGDAAYGSLVYARAPLAFVDAEELVGRRTVVAFLAHLVDRYGLTELTHDELLAEAEAFSAELAAVIDRYWFDPAPLGEPSG